MADSRVSVGFILRAHALKGWVRCRGGGSLPDLERVFVDGLEYAIEKVTTDKAEWLVKLAGVDDRNAADMLQGAQLTAERDWLPEPDAHEVYVADLVGCTLVDGDGVVLGTVTSVTPGAQELLECTTPAGKQFSVPFVDALVVDVDLEARRLTCDLPIGLIDLDLAEQA